MVLWSTNLWIKSMWNYCSSRKELPETVGVLYPQLCWAPLKKMWNQILWQVVRSIPHNSKYGSKITRVSNTSPFLLRKATCPHLQHHHAHWCSLPWQMLMNIMLSSTSTFSSNCNVGKALANPHQAINHQHMGVDIVVLLTYSSMFIN